MRYSCLAPVVLTVLVAACVPSVSPTAPQPAQCTNCRPVLPEPAKATGNAVVHSSDDAKCRPYLPDGYAQCRAKLDRQRNRELLRQLRSNT